MLKMSNEEILESRCFPNECCLKELRGSKCSCKNFMCSGEIDSGLKRQLAEFRDYMRSLVISNTEDEKDPTVYTGSLGLAYTFVRLSYSNMDELSADDSSVENEKTAEMFLSEATKYFSKKFLKMYEKFQDKRIDSSMLCGAAGYFYVSSFYYACLARHQKPERLDSGAVGGVCSESPQEEEILDFSKKFESYQLSFKSRQKYVDLTNLALKENCSDEWLYGRAGFLYGLLTLRHFMCSSVLFDPAPCKNCCAKQNYENEQVLRNSFDKAIQAVASKMIQSGQEYAIRVNCASHCPLMYHWHNKKYLGGAHGLVGIFYMLLSTPEVTSNPVCVDIIKKSCKYILSLETKNMNYPVSFEKNEDYLVQFCHGATAVVFLFLKCADVFSEKQWIEAACRAGCTIWRYGMLRKSISLCHGIAGNAYAFLALYRATKDDIWYNRAIHFALKTQDFSCIKTMKPDHPYSLFEGLAGNILFFNDLIKPTRKSRFPFFEFGSI